MHARQSRLTSVLSKLQCRQQGMRGLTVLGVCALTLIHCLPHIAATTSDDGMDACVGSEEECAQQAHHTEPQNRYTHETQHGQDRGDDDDLYSDDADAEPAQPPRSRQRTRSPRSSLEGTSDGNNKDALDDYEYYYEDANTYVKRNITLC